MPRHPSGCRENLGSGKNGGPQTPFSTRFFHRQGQIGVWLDTQHPGGSSAASPDKAFPYFFSSSRSIRKTASAHDLRRAFGERWATKLMPAQLMELMRHESIDTTLSYYVGRNAERTAAILWDEDRKADTPGTVGADALAATIATGLRK
jgi:hypothetical protein